MSATDVGARNVPPVDDLDDSLFDYDVGDVFRDVDTNMDVSAVHKPAAKADIAENGAGLGIDEEIKVTKKRAPAPKLDENKLLSPAGISTLRRVAKERLKFKGKGHEYSDVARLLNVYQLWLDDLYPRAKFADGLAIIEKLGHKKRIQTMRREWIYERNTLENLDSLGLSGEKPAESGRNHSWEVKSREGPRTPAAVMEDDDDLYTATPKSPRDDGASKRGGDTEDLFLKNSTKNVPIRLGQRPESPIRKENFSDDEDALLALNDVW